MNSKQTNSDQINEYITKITALRDELQNIAKPKFPSSDCILREYGNRILSLLRDIDLEMGDYNIDQRLDILGNLELLMDTPDHLLNSAFKTNRRKFVALMNDYSRAIRKEYIIQK